MRLSCDSTPTPQMAESSAWPSFINASRYIAWWARWKPPTPKWTMPVRSFERSYAGVGISSVDSNSSLSLGIAIPFVRLLDRP